MHQKPACLSALRKASNISDQPVWSKHRHCTFMELGYALSLLDFYYFLQVNVCNFKAAEIFLFEPKGRGLGAVALAAFTVSILSGRNNLSNKKFIFQVI